MDNTSNIKLGENSCAVEACSTGGTRRVTQANRQCPVYIVKEVKDTMKCYDRSQVICTTDTP